MDLVHELYFEVTKSNIDYNIQEIEYKMNVYQHVYFVYSYLYNKVEITIG